MRHAWRWVQVVEIGLSEVFNTLKDTDQEHLIELLLSLHEAGAINGENVLGAVATYTTTLEDLAMDVPKAPQLLGRFFGLCIARDILGLDLLPQLMEGEGAVEPKRRFSAAAFKVVKAAKGDAGLTQACTDASITVAAFLTGDPEFDAEEPPLDKWLESEGLAGLIPL